jgi:hypothetical protein
MRAVIFASPIPAPEGNEERKCLGRLHRHHREGFLAGRDTLSDVPRQELLL